MTNLDCTVTGCMYNKETSCCKDNIQVEGDKARQADETCCGSFRERRMDGAVSSVDYPMKQTEVACRAVDCTFNDSSYCHANHISVAGESACECEETECSSFQCK